MRMKKQLTQVVLAASLTFITWSCNQKDPVAKGDFVSGVFVMNIGNFFSNNGSISFFSREQNTSEADIYSKVHGATLNGGVEDYATFDDRGAILVDNSAAGQDRVEIINSNTFEKVASIGAPDIENPRKVVFANSSKAYVSCWGTNGDYNYKTGYIAVIDLNTNKVTKKINIADGPEKLVLNNGKLFVGTTQYGAGKNLTVINAISDEVVKTITLSGTTTPIGVDANGKLWVGSGIQVSRINMITYDIEAKLAIGTDATKSAGNFAFSTDLRTVFFVLSYDDANYVNHGTTYKFAITDTQVNVTTPFIKRNFSGLNVDPAQGLIYAAVTPSVLQSGYAIRYRTDGSLVDSIKVGIAPIGFFFR